MESLDRRATPGLGFYLQDLPDWRYTIAEAESYSFWDGVSGGRDVPDMKEDYAGTGCLLRSDTSANYVDDNGNLLMSSTESNRVNIDILGPKVPSNSVDMRPISVPVFQVTVKHEGWDSLNNVSGGMLNVDGTMTQQETYEAGDFPLVVGQNSPGGPGGQPYNLHLVFHAEFGIDNQATFVTHPSFEIHVGNLVSLYANYDLGFLVNEPGGLVDQFDPTFGKGIGFADYTADFAVHQGDALDTNFMSDLASFAQGNVPINVTMNSCELQWNLTLTLQEAP
jgi:hypothetical protein